MVNPDKKLFTCSVSLGMMVYAEDEEEARELAEMYLAEEIGNIPPERSDFIVTESLTPHGRRVFADGWDIDCHPYANDGDDEDTIGELFKELEKR